LWSSTAWGATLTWNDNKELDLKGYRVYRCDGLPCTKKVGSSLLATLEKHETSLDIGVPKEIQYYFVTAVDKANRESRPSKVVVFIPVGSPPPPPTPEDLRIVPSN
jgi:fibronectin type 3 domain-containing protein